MNSDAIGCIGAIIIIIFLLVIVMINDSSYRQLEVETWREITDGQNCKLVQEGKYEYRNGIQDAYLCDDGLIHWVNRSIVTEAAQTK